MRFEEWNSELCMPVLYIGRVSIGIADPDVFAALLRCEAPPDGAIVPPAHLMATLSSADRAALLAWADRAAYQRAVLTRRYCCLTCLSEQSVAVRGCLRCEFERRAA